MASPFEIFVVIRDESCRLLLQSLDQLESDISERYIQISIALQQALFIAWQGCWDIALQPRHQLQRGGLQRHGQFGQGVVLEGAYGTRFDLRDSRGRDIGHLCQLSLAQAQFPAPGAYALTQIRHLSTNPHYRYT